MTWFTAVSNFACVEFAVSNHNPGDIPNIINIITFHNGAHPHENQWDGFIFPNLLKMPLPVRYNVHCEFKSMTCFRSKWIHLYEQIDSVIMISTFWNASGGMETSYTWKVVHILSVEFSKPFCSNYVLMKCTCIACDTWHQGNFQVNQSVSVKLLLPHIAFNSTILCFMEIVCVFTNFDGHCLIRCWHLVIFVGSPHETGEHHHSFISHNKPTPRKARYHHGIHFKRCLQLVYNESHSIICFVIGKARENVL